MNGVYADDGSCSTGRAGQTSSCRNPHRRSSERRLLDLRTATLARFDDERDQGFDRCDSCPRRRGKRWRSAQRQGPDTSIPATRLAHLGTVHGLEREDKRRRQNSSDSSRSGRDRSGGTRRRRSSRLAFRSSIGSPPGSPPPPPAPVSPMPAASWPRWTRPDSTRSLAEHREAWSRRWTDAGVVIEGDPGVRTRCALRRLPPALGRRNGGGNGGRSEGTHRRCLCGSRFLGRRRLRPAGPRGDRAERRRGRCSSTEFADCRRREPPLWLKGIRGHDFLGNRPAMGVTSRPGWCEAGTAS